MSRFIPFVRARASRGRAPARRALRAVGRVRAAWRAEDRGRPAWQGWLWTALLVVVLAWFAVQLGATRWYAERPLLLPDGRAIRLPDTFASVDHPFHLAKERAAADALRAGRLPAWFAFHQAGFPAEFYPTGGDVLVALPHVLSFGTLPLAAAHTLAVIGTLLLPPLAYWALARRERLPRSVALLAAIVHLFARGNWLAGGSREAVDYGLWPDTLASYLPLLVLLWGADWLRRGDRRGLLLAAPVAALALYTNPRSALGLAAAGLALGAVALGELPTRAGAGAGESAWRALCRQLVALLGRGVALAGLAALLAAPLILPLLDNQERYQFTIYVRFAAIDRIWSDPAQGFGVGYVESVPPGLIALAGLGLAVGLLRRGFYTRVFAVLLPLSYLLVTLAGWTWQASPVFAQLEGPRLMPLLRPATIFLAALGAHESLRLVARLLRLRGGTMLTGAVTCATAATILLWGGGPLDDAQRGLPLRETTDQPGFAAIARAAYLLDAAAGPADKPLILGNPLSRHASFWIPALTGRAAFHSDHLWFWRDTDYADRGLLCVPDADGCSEAAALDAAFLARHGLTMVLIDTGRRDLIGAAAAKPYLALLDAGAPGGYALYRVAGPPGPPNGYVIPERGAVTALAIAPERIAATVAGDAPQEVRIVVNDFPRWRAWLDGRPAPLARTPDGYIGLAVPAGASRIELRYTLSAANRLGRAGATLGVLIAVGVVLGPALRRRSWPPQGLATGAG